MKRRILGVAACAAAFLSAAAGELGLRAISHGEDIASTIDETDTAFGDETFGEYYSFTGRRGDRIRIRMNSTAVDAYLLLYQGGPNGSEVAHDDDGAGNYDAEIEATLPADGAYAILATTAGSRSTRALPTITGDYRISLQVLESAIVGEVLFYGDEVSGHTSPGRESFTSFWGRQGEKIRIVFVARDFDPAVSLTRGEAGRGGAGGNVIAKDDDATESRSARLEATLPGDGWYMIHLASPQGEVRRSYSMSLSLVEPAAMPIQIGRAITGRIEEGDFAFANGRPGDWYSFEVAREGEYEFVMTSDAVLSHLALFHDAVLGEAEAGEIGGPARLARRLAPGKYILFASSHGEGAGGTFGPYEIEVKAAD